jgi:PAS domain S-box-containing protein
MSTVARLPDSSLALSEYDSLVNASAVLDAIPGAVYLCAANGMLAAYNAEAVALWGRAPRIGDTTERFCGASGRYLPDGQRLPTEHTAMARVLATGVEERNVEVVVERPSGERAVTVANIRPLLGTDGRIQGAISCSLDITARSAFEAAGRRKREELIDFFENGEIGLHIVGADGTILRANAAELAMLGYTQEEYVGRNITEFHVDAPVISDILARLSSGEKVKRQPARLRAKDGSIRHVVITSSSLFDETGFVRTRCFTLDATELKLAEAAREESAERLAATYEAATVGLAETDEVGRFLRVNEALCKILDQPRDVLLGGVMLGGAGAGDPDGDAALYARQVRGELDTYAVHETLVKADGSTACLDVFSSSVRGPDGRFRYGVRVVQDVTEREAMQARLRDSERRMRELLEALPAAVYTTDTQGRLTFFNQAAVALSGRTPVLGTDQWCVTWKLYTPEGIPLPHEECPMAVSLREGRPIRNVEAVAERPDGKRVPFMPYPTPLFDAKGKKIGAVNMLVDISERKEAEARQGTLIDELNHRVKNTLAIVQSLALQTGRHAASIADFTQAFESRLLALSKGHDLLTRRHWQGAALVTLMGDVVAPFAGENVHAKIDGPPVELSPRAALSLTMAVSELVTNAAKYGALSVAGGVLSVSWQTAMVDGEETLELAWRESQGPAVAPPSQRGFGTRLLERCIERDLGGKVTLEFAPSGLCCEIAVPMQGWARHG